MLSDGKPHAPAVLPERKVGLEDTIRVLVGSTGTVVMEHDPAVIPVRDCRDSDLAPPVSIDPFQGVPQEDVEDLLQSLGR